MINEYKNFWENFSSKPIEYRKKPLKILQKPNIDVEGCLKNLSLGKGLSHIFTTSTNEPISFIQRGMGESLRFRNLLDKASEKLDMCDRLAYIAAFSVSYLHILCEGRNRKSFESILGETFEFIDQKDKLVLISEYVSIDPPNSASHAENELWEIHTNIGSNIKLDETKLIYDIIAKIKYIFKNNNQIFISNRPSLLVHELNSENRWCEYKGEQKIEHIGSNARVELTYHGCERYSKENCITGKIFDENNEQVATLEGNYLTKLVYNKKNSDPIIVWEIDKDEKIFFDHFSFTEFTLTLNDPSYPVECLTDSRLRQDIRCFEEAKFEEADRYKAMIENRQVDEEKERKLKGIEYEPKWFKKVYDKDFNADFYIYKNEYWLAKLNKNIEKGQ